MAWSCVVAWALAACAGKEILDLGGDAGPDAGEGEDAPPPASPVGVFPCGLGTITQVASVCTSPDVCCEQFGAVPQCEAPGQCPDLAVACDPWSCPSGSLCCESIQGDDLPDAYFLPADAGHVTGFAKCVQGASCPAGMNQACMTDKDCPPSEGCGYQVLFAPWCVPAAGPDAGSVDAGSRDAGGGG